MKVKKVCLLATAFVLSGLLVSAPTSAAPDGSLRKMLDTNITLVEYITLKTQLKSVERLATGEVTKWGDYSSVVRLGVYFDYDDSELGFGLTPVEDHYFSTIAKAKSYCRDLITAEQISVWLLLFLDSTPNGWTSGSLDADNFQEQLYESAKIRASVSSKNIEEPLPEKVYTLMCEASLDKDAEIKSFSYNL